MRFNTNGSEQMRITSTGDLQFNSGYGSVATAFGCRAWVNFDGTSNNNLTGTYSQTGTTVTVTATAHGLNTGSSVYLDFTSGTAVDGVYVVTVTGVNTFTVQQASRTTSGGVTLVRRQIRNSGNVSSVADNGTANFTVNFINPMPDSDYAIALTSSYSANDNIVVAALDNTTPRVPTNTGFSFQIRKPGSGAITQQYVCATVFR
jgi:hypothetical protein